MTLLTNHMFLIHYQEVRLSILLTGPSFPSLSLPPSLPPSLQVLVFVCHLSPTLGIVWLPSDLLEDSLTADMRSVVPPSLLCIVT